MAIYSGFSHEKWWLSIVMLVHQRVHDIMFPMTLAILLIPNRTKPFWAHRGIMASLRCVWFLKHHFGRDIRGTSRRTILQGELPGWNQAWKWPKWAKHPNNAEKCRKNIAKHSKHIIKCEENRGIAIPRHDELIFKNRVGTPLNHQANDCVASAKGVCFRWSFGHSSTSF